MTHRNNLMLELSKLMITLSTAIIGFVVAAAPTLLRDLSKQDFSIPIGLSMLSIVFTILCVMALVDKAEKRSSRVSFFNDRTMLMVAWIFFLGALFATINAFGFSVI
ncbi:hypothetical protein [Vibrio bivalvicida]|uniref:Uncharacterized protein n=1 Tax=Vibrio bivalvicida TaxID=1276888 RepID=A0ABV4MM57_9VIBR